MCRDWDKNFIFISGYVKYLFSSVQLLQGLEKLTVFVKNRSVSEKGAQQVIESVIQLTKLNFLDLRISGNTYFDAYLQDLK